MTIDVVKETKDYIVFYKRSGVPTVPLRKDPEGSSLLIEASRYFPEIKTVNGKNFWEGGILHRLDTPTSGLVLAARSDDFYRLMTVEQEEGRFKKWYRAEMTEPLSDIPGFIDCPYELSSGNVIESGFVPYGPGRKAVRPVLPGSRKWEEGQRLYETKVVSIHGDTTTYMLTRGFRHQVRCHSAWLGRPLVGDVLYGAESSERFGLESFKIEFLGETVSL